MISKLPTPTSHHSCQPRQEWVVCTRATHSHGCAAGNVLGAAGGFMIPHRPWRGLLSKYCTAD